ncbi:MAG: hypothetical protein QXW14_05710 [Candidatus Nitrosocaldus sp.]
MRSNIYIGVIKPVTMIDGVLIGVIVFGLLHGVNPSHGWLVAVLYSMHSRRPLASSFISSGIIAGAHFLSSMVVVIAYILISPLIEMPHLYLQYGVAIALGVLAYLFWREKGEDFIETQHGHLHDNTQFIEHEHVHWHKDIGYHSHLHVHLARTMPSLGAIASFALMLGFAHEEEFVILALAVGGVDPLLLIVAYATAVAIALIGITVLAVKAYMYVQHKIIPYSRYIPKITASVLAVMAVGFALGLF